MVTAEWHWSRELSVVERGMEKRSEVFIGSRWDSHNQCGSITSEITLA